MKDNRLSMLKQALIDGAESWRYDNATGRLITYFKPENDMHVDGCDYYVEEGYLMVIDRWEDGSVSDPVCLGQA